LLGFPIHASALGGELSDQGILLADFLLQPCNLVALLGNGFHRHRDDFITIV
jgi:hypothetical protein